MLAQMLAEYMEFTGKMARPLRLVLMSGDWIPLDLLPAAPHCGSGGAAVSGLGGGHGSSIWSILYPIEEASPNGRAFRAHAQPALPC